MWRLLRKCFPDAHFRRQVPIRDFIADFASHQLKVVIEVDGGQHGAGGDRARTALIEADGYRVLRFWNHDVLGNGDGVATMLAAYCGGATPTQPSPIKGEGFRGEAEMAEAVDAAVERVFARSAPDVRALAKALIARAQALPDVTVSRKQTCIHLDRRTAFAGLHPRKDALLLNLRSAAPIMSARVRKVERASANRYHNELLIDSADALDEELMGWIAGAHALAG